MERRYRDNTPELIESARRLRNNPTNAEACLWEAIRRRQVLGVRFRRQHPFAGFVLDFCCPELNLAIEIDGAVHDTQREHDADRTQHLETYGYRVIRFTNDKVLGDLPGVLREIEREIEDRRNSLPDLSEDGSADLHALRSPSPRARGEGVGG